MTESDKVKNALTNLTEKVKTDDYGEEYLDVDCLICELRKIGNEKKKYRANNTI